VTVFLAVTSTQERLVSRDFFPGAPEKKSVITVTQNSQVSTIPFLRSLLSFSFRLPVAEGIVKTEQIHHTRHRDTEKSFLPRKAPKTRKRNLPWERRSSDRLLIMEKSALYFAVPATNVSALDHARRAAGGE
jgi:hypothetical protein